MTPAWSLPLLCQKVIILSSWEPLVQLVRSEVFVPREPACFQDQLCRRRESVSSRSEQRRDIMRWVSQTCRCTYELQFSGWMCGAVRHDWRKLLKCSVCSAGLKDAAISGYCTLDQAESLRSSFIRPTAAWFCHWIFYLTLGWFVIYQISFPVKGMLHSCRHAVMHPIRNKDKACSQYLCKRWNDAFCFLRPAGSSPAATRTCCTSSNGS